MFAVSANPKKSLVLIMYDHIIDLSMQKYGEEMNLFAKLALTPKGWAKNVRVIVDQFGRITTVESGVDPSEVERFRCGGGRGIRTLGTLSRTAH